MSLKLIPVLLLVSSTGAFGQTVDSIKNVRSIFVDSLGREAGGDLIREKIIARLVKTGRIVVTEDPSQADAVLKGVGQVSSRTYASTVNGNVTADTRYSATAILRLLGRDGKILWMTEAKPGYFKYGSQSSAVADKVVKELMREIGLAK
jgi:archaeosine-15-forming tRNA-guanine transglycosylase